MINLKCTSCGGTLSVPDNLSVANCIYCGAKILLTESESHKDQLKLKSYTEISESALKAQNYQEAVDYCNKILEIDSKNFLAWINKAIATFWLTTEANNRYDEAFSYLDKAEHIYPGNPKIGEIKKEIIQLQVAWLVKVGTDKLNRANYQASRGEETRDDYISAANYYLQASYIAPDDINLLFNIYVIVKSKENISWSTEIIHKVLYVDYLVKKKQAKENLPKLMESLQEAETNLSIAKKKRNLFAGKKVKEGEERVNKLKDDIMQLEKIISTNKTM
jgi:tetratricopeptide (TPR) repeat protein